jgi:hypothetical protein
VEGFAGLSFAILLRNIDTNKQNRAISIGLCAFVTAWMLAGVIAFAVMGALAIDMSNVRLCFLRHWSAPLADGKQRGLWIGLGVASILIQLALVILAMRVVWPLQMPLAGKITCSIWFGLFTPS